MKRFSPFSSAFAIRRAFSLTQIPTFPDFALRVPTVFIVHGFPRMNNPAPKQGIKIFDREIRYAR